MSDVTYGITCISAVMVVIAAMMTGHDGNLALVTVLGLFGGEKLFKKVLGK